MQKETRPPGGAPSKHLSHCRLAYIRPADNKMFLGRELLAENSNNETSLAQSRSGTSASRDPRLKQSSSPLPASLRRLSQSSSQSNTTHPPDPSSPSAVTRFSNGHPSISLGSRSLSRSLRPRSERSGAPYPASPQAYLSAYLSVLRSFSGSQHVGNTIRSLTHPRYGFR
jgi:hypothetical protein